MGRVFQGDKSLDPEIEFVSEGADAQGRVYEFYLGRISRSPIVKSRASGNSFILSWTEIMNLGIKAGLNKPS